MSLKRELKNFGGIFDVAGKIEELKKIDEESSKDNFWAENEKARKLLKKREQMKRDIDGWNRLNSEIEDLKTGFELIAEENDEGLAKELLQKSEKLKKDVEAQELLVFFTGEYDFGNAFLSIHPGAGGTESQDWASMLLRMYSRWIERRGYSVETVNLLPGDEAGLKDVTLLISGPNAYGYLKSEKGVHRLVRISPFDSNKRRHTSFASVDVMPEVDDVQIEVKDEDYRLDTFRASGAGGQHINRTDSAVRMTHYATNIVVTCQSERSQMKNKAMALKVLKSRLYEYYLREQNEKMKKVQGEKKDIEWGSQIRSHALQPYQKVKDVRTGYETSQSQAVLDGEIDQFIEAYLKANAGAKKS